VAIGETGRFGTTSPPLARPDPQNAPCLFWQLRIQTLAKDAYINQLEQTLERTGAIRAHESGLHPLPPGMISRSGSVVNQGVISRSGSVVNQGNFSRSGSDVNQGMTRSGSDISRLDGMGMVRPQAEGFFTQQER